MQREPPANRGVDLWRYRSIDTRSRDAGVWLLDWGARGQWYVLLDIHQTKSSDYDDRDERISRESPADECRSWDGRLHEPDNFDGICGDGKPDGPAAAGGDGVLDHGVWAFGRRLLDSGNSNIIKQHCSSECEYWYDTADWSRNSSHNEASNIPHFCPNWFDPGATQATK